MFRRLNVDTAVSYTVFVTAFAAAIGFSEFVKLEVVFVDKLG